MEYIHATVKSDVNMVDLGFKLLTLIINCKFGKCFCILFLYSVLCA